MDSAFFLTSYDHEKELPLTEQQFRDLKRARKRLSLVFAISHKFRLIMSNFALIEQQMAKLGSLYISKGDVNAIEQLKPSLNASVNNYVLSARIFTSQLKRHVQGCLPTERQLIADISQAMESQYQRSFAYRFVDALYDYVVYYGLSCHAFLTDSKEVSQTALTIESTSLKRLLSGTLSAGRPTFVLLYLAKHHSVSIYSRY